MKNIMRTLIAATVFKLISAQLLLRAGTFGLESSTGDFGSTGDFSSTGAVNNHNTGEYYLLAFVAIMAVGLFLAVSGRRSAESSYVSVDANAASANPSHPVTELSAASQASGAAAGVSSIPIDIPTAAASNGRVALLT